MVHAKQNSGRKKKGNRVCSQKFEKPKQGYLQAVIHPIEKSSTTNLTPPKYPTRRETISSMAWNSKSKAKREEVACPNQKGFQDRKS
jgi:hypothetical protein